MSKEVYDRLEETGHYYAWFGLVQGYDIKKVADQAVIWGVYGEDLWPVKALKKVIDPYRECANREKLDQKTILADLKYFADQVCVDFNFVKRVFFQIDAETRQSKLEKLVDEAESSASEEEPQETGPEGTVEQKAEKEEGEEEEPEEQ